MKIGKKLIGGFLAVAILFGCASGISFYYIKKVNDSYSDLINRRMTILSNVKDMQALSLQQTNSIRGYLLTDNEAFLTDWQAAHANLNNLIEQTYHLYTNAESKDLLSKLDVLNLDFKTKTDQLLALYQQNRRQEATDFNFREVLPVGNELVLLTKSLAERIQNDINEIRAVNTELVGQINTIVTAINAAAFVFAVLIGFLISRSITRGIRQIARVITGVTPGETEKLPRIEIASKDEIRDIAKAFNGMAEALEEHAKQEKAYKQKLREQSWFEKNIADLATMYQGIQDLETFARLFITKITPMVGASYGVFYIKEGQGDQQVLKKLAAYAYTDQEIGAEGFRLGEGLVGQCALTKSAILLTEVPDHYIQIASGVGKASPASVIILPIEFEGQVLAVIELASFQNFSPIQQTLLHQVLSTAGITIHSIAGRMQVEKLLKESQALTEELQSQSEELQLQQEELRSINEKLEEQNKNSEQKTRELEITRMELEEKARQLALSSQYKSEFLANMSHELRTPLNSLLILAQMLAENREGNLTPKQVEFASTIYSSGNDLLHLINDILDLSKIESGKMEVNPEEVNLGDICAFAERNFLPVARQKGIKFTVRMDADLPTTLFTDEQRLQQILKNLLSNAFKFTEQGSVILHIHKADKRVYAKHRIEHTDPVLAFSVTDTGIGIPKEKQAIIFEAFQQADGTTSRKYGGTGLGLSISREIAHLLGGFIDIHSVEGKGSTFTLYLPDLTVRHEKAGKSPSFIAEAAATLHMATPLPEKPPRHPEQPDEEAVDPLQTIQHEKAPLKGKKILIVDDDMRNVFALTTALENHQMKVVFAENGRDSLEVLRDNPDIDLILMDIMMPEMDGYEAMRAIRQMPEYQTLPIIALTAKAMKNDREKCLEAGASDYISKPVNLEQLFSLMRVWLYG